MLLLCSIYFSVKENNFMNDILNPFSNYL
jgi:hypothetical protein